VKVHELPAAPVSPNTSICRNDTISPLPAALSGHHLIWHNKNHQKINPPVFQNLHTEASTYYLIQKNAATGCESPAAATWVYTVNDLPSVAISSAASYFCENSSAKLTASGTDNYRWNTGATSASITVNMANTYTVVGSDHNGCKDTAQITISKIPLPYVKSKLPADTTVCHGTLLQLGTIGNTTGTVSWNVTPPVIIEHVQYIIATAVNECGRFSDSTRVIHTPLPVSPVISTPRLQSSASFCDGERDTLIAQSAGADIFEWYENDRRIAGVSGATLTVTEPGDYCVKARTHNFCYANSGSTMEVTVHALPATPALTNTSICKAGMIPRLPGASSGYTFLWYDENNQPVGGAPVLQNTKEEKTTYHIKQKNNHTGCESPAAATWVYTVNNLPAVAISSALSYFCEGSSIVLRASGALSYLWSAGNATSANITVDAAGTYTVIGSDHNGCKDTAQITISKKRLPYVKNAIPDTTMCHGSLLWPKTRGNTIGTVSWNVTPPVVINHTQYITATATNECGYFKDSTLVTHVPLPAVEPMDPVRTCENKKVTLTVKSATGNVHWNVPGTTFTAVASETYTVYATNLCGTATKTVPVTVVPLPRVVANNDTTVCYEEEVTLGTQQHVGALKWNSPLTIRVTGPQTYTVTATNECGIASDKMTVDIFTPVQLTLPDMLPPYKYKKYYEQALLLQDAGHPVCFRWLGSLPDGLTITTDGILRGMPKITGHNFDSHRFTVNLEDEYGCTASRAFSLTPLFFAPNSIIRDGSENAYFLPDFDLEIYNRQGVLIHKGRGWAGTSGSSQVPRGTYYYKVDVMQDGELRQYMGHINVLQ
jgi:hypothetical protein